MVDVESTTLDETRELVEIAVIEPRGDLVFTSLVRPTLPPASDAVRLHGLSADILRDAPSFAELSSTLRQHLEGRRLVAYNARFDRSTLELELARNRQPTLAAVWTCLMERWADYCGFRCSLSVACALAEVAPCGPHHRAVADALRAWHLVHTIADRRAL